MFSNGRNIAGFFASDEIVLRHFRYFAQLANKLSFFFLRSPTIDSFSDVWVIVSRFAAWCVEDENIPASLLKGKQVLEM